MKRILILNDVHIGESRVSTSHPGIVRQANSQALAVFEKYLSTFNQCSFDLVVNMGDLIRDLNDKSKDLQLLRSALHVYMQVDAPKIYIPGNHEFKTLSREDIRSTMNQVGLTHALYGLYELGDQHIIWLDSEIGEKDIASVSHATLQWLDQVITPTSNPIIFSHYSVVPLDGKDNFYFANNYQYMSYTNSVDILKILNRCSSVLTINAHVHMSTYKKVNNVSSISSLAFSENITASQYPDANPGVYSILEIRDDGTRIFRSYSGDYCFLNVEL